MPPLIGLIQLLSIGFGLYFVSLIVYTMWGLTHPHRQTYASALARNLPGDPSELNPPIEFEERTVGGIRGELSIWVIKARNPDGPRVVLTHGWGSSRQGALKRLEPIMSYASEIVVWDLPGHGDSQGGTNLGSREYLDLQRVIESFEDWDTRETILYGWSMGSGVSLAYASEFASTLSLQGIICESPYIHPITPARNVIRLRGVPFRLNLRPSMALLGLRFGVGPSWKGFARDELARTIEEPILVIHGSDDPVCPIEDAHRLVEAAKSATLELIEGGGHNNLWTDDIYRAQVWVSVEQFFESLGCTGHDSDQSIT